MITIGVGDEFVGSFLFHNYSLWKIMKISFRQHGVNLSVFT